MIRSVLLTAKDLWQTESQQDTYVAVALVVAVGLWLAYQHRGTLRRLSDR